MCRYDFEPALCSIQGSSNGRVFLQQPIVHECANPMTNAKFCTNAPHHVVIKGTVETMFFGSSHDQFQSFFHHDTCSSWPCQGVKRFSDIETSKEEEQNMDALTLRSRFILDKDRSINEPSPFASMRASLRRLRMHTTKRERCKTPEDTKGDASVSRTVSCASSHTMRMSEKTDSIHGDVPR